MWRNAWAPVTSASSVDLFQRERLKSRRSLGLSKSSSVVLNTRGAKAFFSELKMTEVSRQLLNLPGRLSKALILRLSGLTLILAISRQMGMLKWRYACPMRQMYISRRALLTGVEASRTPIGQG